MENNYSPGPWKLDPRSENLLDKHGNKVEAYMLLINYPITPNKKAVANTELIQAAPMLLQEHITDLIILKDVLTNPYLSPWQKTAIEAMIKDKENIIKKATT